MSASVIKPERFSIEIISSSRHLRMSAIDTDETIERILGEDEGRNSDNSLGLLK